MMIAWRKRKREPGDEKRLIQAVEDIDNEIVICNRMNVRTWELAIDKYSLKKQSKTENIDLIQIP
jgi:hypothetical protein